MERNREIDAFEQDSVLLAKTFLALITECILGDEPDNMYRSHSTTSPFCSFWSTLYRAQLLKASNVIPYID